MVVVRKITNHSSGQVTVVFLFMMTGLVLALLYVTSLMATVYHQTKLQTAADLTAISAARVEARALNGIATLNRRLRDLHNLTKTIFLSGAALAACSLTCPENPAGCWCATKLPTFLIRARKILKRIESTATGIAHAQDQIIRYAPALIIYYTLQFGRQNGAKYVVYGVPATNTLDSLKPTLHVHRGAAKRFDSDKNCGNKCGEVQGILGLLTDLPDLIYPSEQFAQHQRVAVGLFNSIDLHAQETRRLHTKAQARVKFMNDAGVHQADEPLLDSNWDVALEPNTIELASDSVTDVLQEFETAKSLFYEVRNLF